MNFKDFLSENSDSKEVQKVLKQNGLKYEEIGKGFNHAVSFKLGSLFVRYEKNFIDVYKSKDDLKNDKNPIKFFNRLDELIDFYYSLQ